MARSLNNLTLDNPGTMGLNTQDADKVQDHRYATLANNCVISKNGLIESRKGALRTNTTAATGAPIIDVVYSYVQDDGTEIIISTGGNKIWSGTTSLADETSGTPTGDDWQFQTILGDVIGVQAGHAPIFWDGSAATFAALSTRSGSAAGIVNSPCALAAWGRLWLVDTTNLSQINYSDLLVPENFSTGSSGTLDLDTVWPGSNDTITALAAFNNQLVVFGERSIVMFNNANDVSNLSLASTTDAINVIGCVARDSVQQVGNDLFYLSNDGVRSLSRTILQDNLPLGEISAPIRDDIITSIQGATLTSVRSTYNEQEGFYAINFPGDKTYICDVRLAQQGIFRWTTWDVAIYGMATGKDDTLYMGLAGGFLSKYSGYYDTDTSDGSADVSYVVKFRTGWIEAESSLESIWKKLTLYIYSAASIQAIVTWALDFSSSYKSETKPIAGQPAAKYGSFKYGDGTKYGRPTTKQKITYSLSGVGSVIQLGFQSVVAGGKMSFNKMKPFYKSGASK